MLLGDVCTKIWNESMTRYKEDTARGSPMPEVLLLEEGWEKLRD